MPLTKRGHEVVHEGGFWCRKGGGIPVHEVSRKGLGRGPGRGVPVQEGGGGSCQGRGFLGDLI